MNPPHKRQISVFGLGHVGLATAVSFAKKSYRVLGIDPDRQRLEEIRRAESPFLESKLTDYLADVIGNGMLSVTDDASLNAQSDLAYITVGTPSNKDGSIDLTYVRKAAVAIGRSLRDAVKPQVVVVKSTVAPGTARNLVKPIIEKQSGKIAGRQFRLCSNPEFLREGNAIHDTEFPDRIIIGSEDAEAIRELEDFYKEFHDDRTPEMVRTTYENAELIKYANNAFLAMKVSFINTIANIAERTPGADVETIAFGIGLDERIGSKFLNAGLGWGGSCFPKDVNALLSYGKKLDYRPELIEAVVEINRKQTRRAVQLAKHALGSLKGRRIAVLGLAFKPQTDDMREAVSISVIRGLLAGGARVTAYDPAAMQNARAIFGNTITYAKDPVNCIDQSECCIIVTEWNEFRSIPPSSFVERMRRPIVIDGRRIYDPERFSEAGIKFAAIGLGPRARRLDDSSAHSSSLTSE